MKLIQVCTYVLFSNVQKYYFKMILKNGRIDSIIKHGEKGGIYT